MREVQLIQTLYFNAWRWKFLLIVAGICATVPEGLHSSFENTPACERQKTAVTGRGRHPRMYDSINVLWLLPFHQSKRKELTPHTSRIRTFFFFAEEIDIQSSLKVNLIIIYDILFCAIQELRE